jgi:hypothetical protein
MTHGDAVVDGDRVEFLGDAAGRFDLAGDELAQILQVHVAGHELGEGVHHGDDRLAEVAVLHAGRTPKPARACHVAAMGRGSRAVSWHGVVLDLFLRAGTVYRFRETRAKARGFAAFLAQSARSVTITTGQSGTVGIPAETEIVFRASNLYIAFKPARRKQ